MPPTKNLSGAGSPFGGGIAAGAVGGTELAGRTGTGTGAVYSLYCSPPRDTSVNLLVANCVASLTSPRCCRDHSREGSGSLGFSLVLLSPCSGSSQNGCRSGIVMPECRVW